VSALPGRPLPRIMLSTVASISGVVLLLSLKPHATGGATSVTGSAAIPAPTATAPATGSSGGTSSGSGSTSGGSSGGTSSGTRTVTGDTVQTRYGPVQLSITLTNGKITAVKTLQLPTDNPRDQEISSFAVPQLTQEALSAQSAKIDTVSGATYTSEGYAQSLQSALDQAGHG
jgi:uncharacterized protein with FMN-binding domain